ncbi:MAG: hypothetical protein AAF799_42100 [Myxococcota bacterium]
MNSRVLVLLVALTSAYVLAGVYTAYALVQSAYQVPNHERSYSDFIFAWDWWKRSDPEALYEDTDVVAYVSSVGGRALSPHEVEEVSKWLVVEEDVGGRKVAAIGRFRQPHLFHYSPFFAANEDGGRIVFITERSLMGIWDSESRRRDRLKAVSFLFRGYIEQMWPSGLQFDTLGDLRRANEALKDESRANPFRRDFKVVDGEKVDFMLQQRIDTDGLDGLEFDDFPADILETVHRFVEQGNTVWIVSIARSQTFEPLYAERMAKTRDAISELAADIDGIEHLYFPALHERYYRDHAHMNAAGSALFHEWLTAQLDAHDAGQPLPGTRVAP